MALKSRESASCQCERPNSLRIKLDENIGRRGLELLRAAGHDVMTVRDQNIGGTADDALLEVCATEGRTLVTLDHDFGQVTRFPPEKSAGIVVLEAGPHASLSSIIERLREFLVVAGQHSVAGLLWIVEPAACGFIFVTRKNRQE
jgi:predicted nuclease of predicted toxin-antitoxin system